jgi:hypothetical protein
MDIFWLPAPCRPSGNWQPVVRTKDTGNGDDTTPAGGIVRSMAAVAGRDISIGRWSIRPVELPNRKQ